MSSSPEARRGTVVIEARGGRARNQENGQAPPSTAKKLGAVARHEENTRERRRHRLGGLPSSPFLSLATRRGMVASAEASPARGRNRLKDHQPRRPSLSAPPAKRDHGGNGNAGSCRTGATVSSGGSGGSDSGKNGRSGPETAAAVVRDGRLSS